LAGKHPTTTMNDDLIDTAGRILIAFLFLFQAVGAIGRFDFHAGRLRACKAPAPNFVLAAGIAMMLVGGSMVLFNIFSRYGAVLLLIFTIVATILFQNFWSIDDPARRREKRTSFMYNLAIIGGLLLVVSRGTRFGGW
jgi:putative oxidoreductase